MTLKEDIRSISVNLDTPELLWYILDERFPKQTVVTASLKAPSIVVLKMISMIDPSTPVVFCQRPPIFEESIEYRAKIVDLLGLTNVSSSEGHEISVRPGDKDHCEHMWIQYRNIPGQSFERLHLNGCLAPYDCWISAVYHIVRPNYVRNRVDVEGRLIKVDPLIRWTRDEVREFMRAHGLPYHKLAARKYNHENNPDSIAYEFYHF